MLTMRFKRKLFFYYLLILLLFVLPFSKVFVSYDDFETEDAWKYQYLYEDWYSIMIFIPLFIRTVLFTVISHPKVKKFFKWVLMIMTFLYTLLGLMSLFIGTMDSVPSYGTYVMVLIFPVFYWINKNTI